MRAGSPASISLILIFILLVTGVILISMPPPAKAQDLPPPATLFIFSDDVSSNNLTNANLKPGSTFIIDVRADNLNPIINSTYGGVSGFDIILNYDFHILKATGLGYSTFDTPACPSTDGCLYDGLSVLLFNKKVDSPPGQSRLAIAGQGPANRIQGMGILFRILFQVKGLGYTNVEIDSMSTITGPLCPTPNPPIYCGKGTSVALPYTASNGSFDNTPLFTLSATPSSGRVLLGRSVTANVTALMMTGGPQNISLSAAGLPSGSTANFSPSFGDTTFTSFVNITTIMTTPTGNYTVRITGLCTGCINGVDFTNDLNFTLSVNIRNVAVVSVTPSTSAADVGRPIPVSATVKNKGTEYETFTLDLFANTTITASQSSITLRPGASQTITLAWDTTAFQPGSYNVTAQIPILPGEANITDNLALGGTVSLVSPNVGVTSVTPSPTVLDAGHLVSVSVTVRNGGLSSETFTVNLLENVTIVATQSSVTLGPGDSQTLTLTWNTVGFQPGTYNINATIPPLAGESNVADNSRSGGIVSLVSPNVGVTSVTPSPTALDIGRKVSVSVTVDNTGASLETFTVNLKANTTIAAFQSVSLAAGASQTLSFTWDTTTYKSGVYSISAQVPPISGEVNVTDNIAMGGNVRLVFPDEGVSGITATPDVVNPDQTVSITVTVANHGMSSENFTVNVLAISPGGATTQLGSSQVTSLAAGQSTTITASWSTTGFNSGNYTIRAAIPVLQNETISANNSFDLTIRLNTVPTATFSLTTTAPTAGQSVNFDASQSSDTDGTIATYSWNFGDGTTGTGKTVTHTYQTEGTYTATLTVTDNDGGTKTTTRTVAVASAPNLLTSPLALAGIGILTVLVIAALLLVRRRRGKSKP